MMNRQLHSHYDITKKDNILLVDAKRIFDEDSIEQYHQDMLDLTLEMKHQPWASLICYEGSGVFTPEVEQHIIDITKFRVKNNMVANATVLLNTAHADIQQMQLRRIYNSCQLPFFVFSDRDSAEAWLQDYLKEQTQVV
ncbi:hypothetical protein [Thalassotalea euphylliae]|nr:hypothetical protein [Thalassotalea euphylliae]